MLSVRVLTVNVIATVCLKKYWRAVHAVMLLIETALFQLCRPQSSQIHHLLFMLFNSNLSTSHVLLGCSIYHISLAEAGGDRQTTNSHHACLSWYTHTVIHYASCACAHTHTNTLQPHPKTHSFTPRSTSLPSHPCPQCIWLWTYSTEMESFCFPSVRWFHEQFYLCPFLFIIHPSCVRVHRVCVHRFGQIETPLATHWDRTSTSGGEICSRAPQGNIEAACIWNSASWFGFWNDCHP